MTLQDHAAEVYLDMLRTYEKSSDVIVCHPDLRATYLAKMRARVGDGFAEFDLNLALIRCRKSGKLPTRKGGREKA